MTSMGLQMLNNNNMLVLNHLIREFMSDTAGLDDVHLLGLKSRFYANNEENRRKKLNLRSKYMLNY